MFVFVREPLTSSPCVAYSLSMYPYHDDVPCGRRGRSSVSWCALDLLTMRQRSKKKPVMPSRYRFYKVTQSCCNLLIDCFYICSHRPHATPAVRVQGSQQQLDKVTGKMGKHGASSGHQFKADQEIVQYIYREAKKANRDRTLLL
jgi:hypothetical protein